MTAAAELSDKVFSLDDVEAAESDFRFGLPALFALLALGVFGSTWVAGPGALMTTSDPVRLSLIRQTSTSPKLTLSDSVMTRSGH